MEEYTEVYRYSHPHFNYDIVWVKDKEGNPYCYYDKED